MIDGKMVYLWRAVDYEGTALDVVVQRRRNSKVATRLLRKIIKNQGIKPVQIVTDRLRSYDVTLKVLGLKKLQDVGGKRPIAPNVLTLQYDAENENHKNSDLSVTLKSYCPLTVKSTTPSITDAILSIKVLSESSDFKQIQNRTS